MQLPNSTELLFKRLNVSWGVIVTRCFFIFVIVFALIKFIQNDTKLKHFPVKSAVVTNERYELYERCLTSSPVMTEWLVRSKQCVTVAEQFAPDPPVSEVHIK